MKNPKFERECAIMDWKSLLREHGFLLADGAWGTQLAKLGLQVGEPPEVWNLEHPEKVRGIASAYLETGAQIVLTNTFGGSRFKLEKCGLGDRAREINRIGAALSREAADDRALVFASLGPTGEFLEPLGPVMEAQMIEAFADQVRGFVEGGADGVVVETMTDLDEAKCALRAVREESNLPAAICLTFDRGPRGIATMMGVTPERAASELEAAGAEIVGSNCGAGIEQMVEVARAMRDATSRPLWMKPNAGLPELVDGETVFRQTPEEMAAHLPALIEAGANIVGGCCGTTPDHIQALERARPEVEAAARVELGRFVRFS